MSTPPTSEQAPEPAPQQAPEPAAEQAAEQGPSAPPRRSAYSMGSTPNLLRSLLVIGLFVLALFAIVPRIDQVERPAIDALSKAEFTASQTGWPVELPTGLGDGWVPTVATYAPGTEKVPTFTTVWATPSGKDIALKQAVAVTDGWLARSVNDTPAAGTVDVGGRAFDRYAAGDGSQTAYVERGAGAGGLTIVASGTAGEDELRTLVTALKPVTPSP